MTLSQSFVFGVTDQRVGKDPTHTVAKHHKMVGGKVSAGWIKHAKGLVEDPAKDGSVVEHRSAGPIVVMPNLVSGINLPIGEEVVDEIDKRNRRRLQAMHHEQRDAVRIVALDQVELLTSRNRRGIQHSAKSSSTKRFGSSGEFRTGRSEVCRQRMGTRPH